MRFARHLLAGLALATVAAPALAMTEPPTEPGSGSSTGSTGGSTGGSSGTAVPEPGMFGIMGLALAGVVIARRRRKA